MKLEKITNGNYKIFVEGVFVGRVTKERGIWKSYTPDMKRVSTYNETRKDAIETIINK